MPRFLAPAAVVVALCAWFALDAGASPADADGRRLRCRTFPVALDGDGFDTDDGSQPIGAWVLQEERQGWSLHSVQLAVGQKTTGYPQGFQQVCLSPR